MSLIAKCLRFPNVARAIVIRERLKRFHAEQVSVPDVAFPASAHHDGYLVYTSSGIVDQWSVIGGTFRRACRGLNQSKGEP